MKRTTFIVGLIIAGLSTPLGTGPAAAESAAVAEAFSRLNALGEEVQDRLRGLDEPQDTRAAPQKAGTAPSDEPRTDMPACGLRPALLGELTLLRKRYESHGSVIVDVHEELTSFRGGVLDVERACSRSLAEDIADARQRVAKLDLDADHRQIDGLTICMDKLRRKTDSELNETKSNIRLQRLAAEMERLHLMTDLVTELERALVRGVNKRGRIVQELGQFQQEIQDACQ